MPTPANPVNPAAWPADKLKRIRALLAEDAAVLVSLGRVEYKAAAVAGGGARKFRVKMVRQWKRISDGDRADCEAYLALYASADNGTESRTVTDPKADRTVYEGTWRQKRTDLTRQRTDPNEQGVYQTLLWPADASSEADGEWAAEETWLNHVHVESSTGDGPAQIPCGRPPRGTRLSVSARLDKESGEWDSELRTDTALADQYTFFDGDALSTSEHRKGEHQGESPIVTEAQLQEWVAQKYNVQLASEMDGYGTLSTHLVLTKGKAWSKVIRLPRDTETVYLLEFRNWTQEPTKDSFGTVTSAHGSGHWLLSVNANPNQYGTLDGSAQLRVPITKVVGPFPSEKSAERNTATVLGYNVTAIPAINNNQRVSPRLNEFGLYDYEKQTIDPAGSMQNGGSYSYTHSDGWGVRSTTTITSSKGWQRKYVVWGHWTIRHNVRIQKHASFVAACAALNGAQNVVSAHVSEGGPGIWYSHLATWTKTWD